MNQKTITTAVLLTALALSGVAGMYFIGQLQRDRSYSDTISLIHQIDQLSASWSMETARVRTNPLADFDRLAAFIPQMERLKERLETEAHRIEGLPERLRNDINSYVSSVDAREERIERFKSGYAIVRNSNRYLPIAVRNIIDEARTHNQETLARAVSEFNHEMIEYLRSPGDERREALARQIASWSDESVEYPVRLANMLANLVSHAEVLLNKNEETARIFEEATSDELTEHTNRLTKDLKLEQTHMNERTDQYRIAIGAGTIGVMLICVWVVLMRKRSQAKATPAPAPEAAAAAPAQEATPRAGPEPVDDRSDAGLDQARPERQSIATQVAIEAMGQCLSEASKRLGNTLERADSTRRELLASLGDDGDDGDEAKRCARTLDGLHTVMGNEAEHLGEAGMRAEMLIEHERGTGTGGWTRSRECIRNAIDGLKLDTGTVRIEQVLEDDREWRVQAEDLHAMVQALVGNAFEAMHEKEPGGTIRIETRSDGPASQLTVIDNGHGIDPREMGQIARAFHSTRAGHVGLGLTVAQTVAERGNGTMQVNSAKGQGTVVRIKMESRAHDG